MQLSVLKMNQVFVQQLPEKVQGQFWVMHHDEDGYEDRLISIEAVDGQWVIKSTKKVYLIDQNGDKIARCVLENSKVYSLKLTKTDEIIHIYSEPISADRQVYKKLILPKSGSVLIGRGEGSDIQYRNKYVSSKHAEITILNDQITVTALSKSNATYLNGKTVFQSVIKPGDVLQIIGLKIIFGKEFIAINNPDSLVSFNESKFIQYKKQDLMANEDEFDEDELEELQAYKLFYKSPKFKKGIQEKEIRIDLPPPANNREETPLLLSMGPSFTMGVAAIATAVLTVQYALNNNSNMRFVYSAIIMAVSMLVGSILFPILMRRFERKKKQKYNLERKQKYGQYIESIQQEITEEIIVQSSLLHQNYLSVDECATNVLNESSDIWHVTKDSTDFLRVRLGKGEVPLRANIKFPEKRFSLEDDDLQEQLFKFKDQPKVVTNVPITMSLKDDKVVGIVGDEKQAKALTKSIVLQLASLHGYDELQMVFVYDKKEQREWDFVKWLPHVWSSDEKVRFVATDSVELKKLTVSLEQEFNRRLSSSAETIEEQLPHVVYVLLDPKLTKKSEVFMKIAKEKRNHGFSIIFVDQKLANTPKDCTKVLQIVDSTIRVFDKNNLTSEQQLVRLETYSHQNEEEISKKLANLRLSTMESTFTLPERLTFLEMFEVGKIEHLNPSARWKNNDPTATLETRIGIDEKGEWLYLDLHEKYHGPHGLIAGMTGSGKSEFIMTYILSLAVNYHPDDVAFILIDYKGGGMANTFLNLPHVAGTITNLDGAAVNRSLISIESELKRRQAIFSEIGKKLEMSNIDIYKYQKLYRDGKVNEPLPHLFIISDEFAELKSQQPEFMDQLISAARIGRSLGVHLILATQKPSGVVNDQIWSNSKFRISLKVQDYADSKEMLNRPEAAELTVTGRFYLQVGNNEIFKLGQSSWSGADYYPEEIFSTVEENQVTVIDTIGQVLAAVRESKRTGSKQGNQIEQITKYLSTIAQEENISVRKIWLEPLDSIIRLDELNEIYLQQVTSLINPLIGEIDDPVQQRRLPLNLNVLSDGNTIVYGTVGSGKTTFITTYMASIMESYSPKDVHMYVLDFASETLRGFKDAPHVGDVVISHEVEKVHKLFDELSKELEARKKRFATTGGDYASYIASGGKIPAIIVFIHNYSAFNELYYEQEQELRYLSREGLKYGITFILTALTPGAVKYNLAQNFNQTFVLQQNNASDYSSILGSVDGIYPAKFKGRGIVKLDRTYEFQIAHVLNDTTYTEMTAFSEKMKTKWPAQKAKPIPVLPEVVNIDYMRKYAVEGSTPIGVEKHMLEIVTLRQYDENKSNVHIVTGQTLDDVGAISGIVEGVVFANKGALHVVDPESIIVKSDNYSYYENDFDTVAMNLYQLILNRNNSYKAAARDGLELPTFETETYVFIAFNTFIERLTPEVAIKLKQALAHLEKHYHIHLIIFDTQVGLKNYSIDTWYKSKVKEMDGIWLGGGIDGIRLPKIPSTRGLDKELPEGFGYVVVSSKAKLVKLLKVGAVDE